MDQRQERINRLSDPDWQTVYLTAFVCICNRIYAGQHFDHSTEKMQWFATGYNAGFHKNNEYLRKKIKAENFYLEQNMPGKKFRYAAIASWFYDGMPK